MALKKDQSKPVTTSKKSKTSLKVAGGILAGAAAGAIAGILMAPDSGKNTRKKIAVKSKEVANTTKNKVVGSVKKAVSAGKKKLGMTGKKPSK